MTVNGLTIPTRPPEPVPAVGVATLEAALETECRLLSELGTVLRERRGAVVEGDANALDENGMTVHRVIRTLEEARRHRRAVIGFLAPAEDTPLDELDLALGKRMTPELIEVRARLRDEVRNVLLEIDIDLQVQRTGLGSGAGICERGPETRRGSGST